MEKDQYIAHANAVLFGFKKGLEASIQYLRRVAAHAPENTAKAVIAKLSDDLEQYAADECADLLKVAMAVAANKAPDATSKKH